MKERKSFVPIYLTAMAHELVYPHEEISVMEVTVLVTDFDALLKGPPTMDVWVEYDGELHRTIKGNLYNLRFATRKGAEARLQEHLPCNGVVHLSAFDRSVREMIKAGSRVVLDSDPKRGIYILPAIRDDGRLEYQVSNGLDGGRSYSRDMWTYKQAKAEFQRIQKEGW